MAHYSVVSESCYDKFFETMKMGDEIMRPLQNLTGHFAMRLPKHKSNFRKIILLTISANLGIYLRHLMLYQLIPPSAAYMHQWIGLALVQIMACHLFGGKPLSEPMLGYCQLDTYDLGTNSSEILIKIQNFSFKKMHLAILSAKWSQFCLSLNVLRLSPGSEAWNIFCGLIWEN